MKHLFKLVCILLIASCNQIHKKRIPEEFSSFINSRSTEINYKAIDGVYGSKKQKVREKLSKNEAIEDVDMLEYLMKTSYSGYEYWKKTGVNFDSCFKYFRIIASKKDSISSLTLEKEIAKMLKLLGDGHIAFEGHGYMPAKGHKSVYFADIILEKNKDSNIIVIESRNKNILKGSILTEKNPKQYLFPTLSPEGTQHYLLGILSFEYINDQTLSFDHRKQLIPFHENRMLFAKQQNKPAVSISRINDIAYLRLSSFRNHLHTEMQKFISSADTLKKETCIIINVMNNGGGSSVYPQNFIQSLNGSLKWEMHWGELLSPAIAEYFFEYDPSVLANCSPGYKSMVFANASRYDNMKKRPQKTWSFSKSGHSSKKGQFEGKLIILTNRSVISGGESMTGSSLCIKNRIAIGENTGGVAQFSSNCNYYLPNSKIIAHLPRQMIIIPGLEECIGYKPDYWLDSRKPIEETLKWLKDNSNYRFSYSQPYNDMLKEYSEQVNFPDSINIIKCSQNISDSIARFSGYWFGMDGGKLGHGLLVKKIDDKANVEAIYAWGNMSEWNVEAGWMELKGSIVNGQLKLKADNYPIKISYSFNSDGSLYSIFERPGIYAETRLVRISEKKL